MVASNAKCGTGLVLFRCRALHLTDVGGRSFAMDPYAISLGKLKPIGVKWHRSNGALRSRLSVPRSVLSRSFHCRIVCAATDAVQDVPIRTPDGPLPQNECQPAYDREGNIVEVMCCDYGFRSGTGRMYQDRFGEIPMNAWELGVENFKAEYKALRKSVRFDEYNRISQQNPPKGLFGKLAYGFGSFIVSALSAVDKSLEEREIVDKLTPEQEIVEQKDEWDDAMNDECSEILAKLKKLKLSNDAVWERERAREKQGAGIESPFAIKTAYYLLCYTLDVLFNNRPIQRFWFLEVVARMPYFSYISMLHLYESLGWWRAGAELRKVHFAEEWNELHHLQIMETLGGDQMWIDRFLAQHAAVFYYWVLLFFYLVSPQVAYNFSELIEAHAVDTYGEFIDSNEAILKSLPPPKVAVQYYLQNDIYMFDTFQTSKRLEPRRPSCANMYETFCNIREDESEHVKTMQACQDFSIAVELDNRRKQMVAEGNGSVEE